MSAPLHCLNINRAGTLIKKVLSGASSVHWHPSEFLKDVGVWTRNHVQIWWTKCAWHHKNRCYVPRSKMKLRCSHVLLVTTQTLKCNGIYCVIFTHDDGGCTCVRQLCGHCRAGKYLGLPAIVTGVSSIELQGDANAQLILGDAGSGMQLHTWWKSPVGSWQHWRCRFPDKGYYIMLGWSRVVFVLQGFGDQCWDRAGKICNEI